MTTLFAAHALLPSGPARDVLIEISDGRFASVTPDAVFSPGATRLPVVVVPGFANAHSHAFHRALRGRTHGDPKHGGGGTFWTWRRAMYALAARLDPDNYLALARAVYAEMALAGITTVGEFHYVHHAPGGRRYDDPNAMGHALRQAAGDAGVRLTLLDTCYLEGGLGDAGHLPLDDLQARFSDGSASAWASRLGDLAAGPGFVAGAAIHSVRAVARADLARVAAASAGRPLHVHLSEQPAENQAALAYYGRTPAALLGEGGALTPRTTVVHATHLSAPDISLLGGARVTACFCPTTEQDLADGIGPARALADAGARLSLGSDQNAVIDLIGEARALESGERLASLRRGRFRPGELLAAATAHDSLGWADAGAIAPGKRADLVCVRTDTVRTAGADPAQILLAATAADVDSVWVDGVPVVSGGAHRLGDVAGLLAKAIGTLWADS